MNYGYDALKLGNIEIVNGIIQDSNKQGIAVEATLAEGTQELIQTYTERRTRTVHYAESYKDGFDKPVKYGNLGELKRC